MEETGAFVATPPWQVYLPISARTVGLYCLYGARFPLDAVWMASSTSWFAAAIAWDGIEDDNEPLGSGRPFLGCSHLNKAIFAISFFASILHVWNLAYRSLGAVFISSLKIIRAFNFRGCWQPRKFFNSENFPIYGSATMHAQKSLNLELSWPDKGGMFRKWKYRRKQVGKFVKQLDWPEHMIVVYVPATNLQCIKE